MVTGLNFCDEFFAILSPHYSREILDGLDIEFWDAIVPGFDNYPGGVKRVFPYLLASLFYHEDYLRRALSNAHPIWSML